MNTLLVRLVCDWRAPFPSPYRVLRYGQEGSTLFPTEAFIMPDMPEFSREGIRFVVMGIIAEEVDNTRVMMDLRGTSPVLPVGYTIFRNRQQGCHILLQEAAFNAFLADMFADGFRVVAILLDFGLFRYLAVWEKCVRTNAPAVIITIPKKNVSARRAWCKNT
jgi:hypothetical protein